MVIFDEVLTVLECGSMLHELTVKLSMVRSYRGSACS